MLWAQFAPPQNPAQANAMVAGAICMGVVCAIIVGGAGLAVGLSLQKNPRACPQPYIAYAIGGFGALVSGIVGFLFGCIGGLPAAILFVVVIVILLATVPTHGPKRRRRRRRYPDDEDDYDDRPRRRRYDEDDEDEDDRPRRRRRDPDDY